MTIEERVVRRLAEDHRELVPRWRDGRLAKRVSTRLKRTGVSRLLVLTLAAAAGLGTALYALDGTLSAAPAILLCGLLVASSVVLALLLAAESHGKSGTGAVVPN